jgi:hypothetical protein
MYIRSTYNVDYMVKHTPHHMEILPKFVHWTSRGLPIAFAIQPRHLIYNVLGDDCINDVVYSKCFAKDHFNYYYYFHTMSN